MNQNNAIYVQIHLNGIDRTQLSHLWVILSHWVLTEMTQNDSSDIGIIFIYRLSRVMYKIIGLILEVDFYVF
jgi:hypothetical protein